MPKSIRAKEVKAWGWIKKDGKLSYNCFRVKRLAETYKKLLGGEVIRVLIRPVKGKK